MVVVTHHIDDAAELADQVIAMRGGPGRSPTARRPM